MGVELHLFTKDEPQETSIRTYGVCQIPSFYLTLGDFWMPRPYEGLGQAVQSFNDFQKSDAPDWLKIAVNFSVDNSFVEKGDRSVVADALRKTYEYVHPDNKPATGGRHCPGLLELADYIEDEGSCLVTNTFNPHLGALRSITLEDARNTFPRAVNVPSTTNQEQLYLLRHSVVSNLLAYQTRFINMLSARLRDDLGEDRLREVIYDFLDTKNS